MGDHLVPLLDLTASEAAGEFSAWLRRFVSGPGDMQVPCGGCNACCRSRLFVHIGADESETLAAIPRALQFPAPGRPGDVVLGYDESGACPMLVDGECSIYSRRPRACRAFDCRVFAAAGRGPADPHRRELLERASRWRFAYADADARAAHARLAARLADLDVPIDDLARQIRGEGP